MTDRAEIAEAARRYVWAGFYDADEVGTILSESFDLAEDEEDWLQAEVESAMAKKRAEEATWPAVTDCDRLDRVFEALEDESILALQDAGMTKSDGMEEVEEAYEDAGGEDSDIVGYCFFHGQDLESVMESGDLWLAFGDIRGDDDRGVEIGRLVANALERAGFAVKWNGSIRERILASGIRWQKRSE